MSREIGVAIGLIEGAAIVALGVLIWKLTSYIWGML